MGDGAKSPGSALGLDLVAGEAPVPWGAASEADVLEEVVRRLSEYGEATIRLDGYTPFPLDYPAFQVEMERVARALLAPAAVNGEGFTYVFTGRSSDFSDPGHGATNARLRREFLHQVEELVETAGTGTVDTEANSTRAADSTGDSVPPGARVTLRAGDRALRFIVEERSVEELAWETGRDSTVLTEGVALDSQDLERFLQRARGFLYPGP